MLPTHVMAYERLFALEGGLLIDSWVLFKSVFINK